MDSAKGRGFALSAFRVSHGLLECFFDVDPRHPGLLRVLADACMHGLRGGDGQLSGLDFLPGAGFQGEQAGREVEGYDGILRAVGLDPSRRMYV